MAGSHASRVMAFRLLLEYDGTRFQGWQGQGTARGFRTVSDMLARAVEKSGFSVVQIVGAGRTDSGVHALGQVAHLHLDTLGAAPPIDLQRMLTRTLPSDLVVRSAVCCDPRFHARHHAVSRSYLYQLALRPSALAHHFAWTPDEPPDPSILANAWRQFEGFIDVSSFAIIPSKKDPRVEVQRCDSLQCGAVVLLRVTASHFLPRMVRRVVGACVRCAQGLADMDRLIHDIRTPSREAGLEWGRYPAPPHGLFLEHVQYPGEADPGPLQPIVRVE